MTHLRVLTAVLFASLFFTRAVFCASLSSTDDLESSDYDPKRQDHPSHNAAEEKKGSLSEKLFQNNIDLAYLSLNSCFVQGIAQGNLDPTKYGAYNIQDAYWVYNESVNSIRLKEMAQDQSLHDLANFASYQIKIYEEESRMMAEEWHLQDLECVAAAKTLRDFLDFHRTVLNSFPPYYTVGVLLPCEKLWYWLGLKLLPRAGEDNIYSFWIHLRAEFSSAPWEKFVDEHAEEYDEEILNKLYEITFVHEVNFFRSACGEKPMPVPKMPKPPM